ncbi:MAG: glycosyltransferase family 4 protein [Nitrospiraceae bacterium]|nr:glycosyltransferase family 4 protein [Nitrospiraceae bacterium]
MKQAAAKVCHLTTVHDPFDDRIFHRECRTLAAAGYDVTLIAQHGGNETVQEVDILGLPKAKSRTQRILGITWKALWRAIRQKADIYHFHDPELLPAGVFLKLLTGKKVIYDVHEDYGRQILYKPYFPRRIRRIVACAVGAIEHIAARCFDAIVTATDDIQAQFAHHKRAVSIKNFPILSYFQNISRTDGNGTGRHAVFTIVYIGVLAEARGALEMVRALEYINMPVRMALYGNYYPESLELRVANAKGGGKVDYMGLLSHEKVVQLLKNYDAGIVCLHPTLNYLTALPVKLFEYMAAGIPVIASNFPLWKGIVEDNGCGICVNPLDPEDIARAIDVLMRNPEAGKEMGKKGRKAVLEKYNWDKESGKLLNVYKEVLQR